MGGEICAQTYQKYTGFPVTRCHNHDVDNLGCADDWGTPFNRSETLDQVYLNWIHLQVSHWQALGTLTRVFASPVNPKAKDISEVPKVSLLAVRYPTTRSVEPWKTTVTDLLSQAPSATYSAEDVIDVIVSSTAASMQKTNQHSVFTTFKSADDMGQPIKFTGTIHSEIALASLARYSHKASTEQIKDSADLMQLLQVTF
jgi:hypothetical protein